MEKFISRVALFSGMLLLYGLGMFATNELIYRLTPPPVGQTSVLIAGDSHLMNALDPAAFPDAVNVSRFAEPYAVTYWKLREILGHVRPDTVILGLSPGNFSSYSDRVFAERASARFQFAFSHRLLDFPALFRDFGVHWKQLVTTLVRKRMLYPGLDPYAYIGGFRPEDRSAAGTAAARISRHYDHPAGPPATVSTTMVSYLDSILYLCGRRRVTPIVVSTPHRPAYRAGVPRPILAAYREKLGQLRRRGITTVDAFHWSYPASHHLDADHLNRRGATRFSAELVGLISSPAGQN